MGAELLFPTWEFLTRVSREVMSLPTVEVDDELRGWSWASPPVSSPPGIPLGVSDITSGFCSTGRDVYLRYVMKEREEDNSVLQVGRLVHSVFSWVIEGVKKIMFCRGMSVTGDDLEREMKVLGEEIERRILSKYELIDKDKREWLFRKLWGKGTRTYVAALEEAKSKSRFFRTDSLVYATVPVLSEFPIDGSLIGLSPALRIDALMPPHMLMELKTRRPRHVFEITLAGYALAFESQYRTPIDHAILTYINIRWGREVYARPNVIPISQSLREEFIELRDSRKEIITYGIDPGKPPECSEECPYRRICGER